MTKWKPHIDVEHPALQDDPSATYTRSHHAQVELLKLIITLATGILAAYFIAITQKAVVLDASQRIMVLAAIAANSLTILSGIGAWFFEGRRQFFWAISKSTKDDTRRAAYLRSRNRYYRATGVAMVALGLSFAAGIACSAIYLVLAVLSEHAA